MSVDRIVSSSWDIASQYPEDPQEEFRIALANYIHGYTMVYIGIDDDIANDSWISDTFEDKCKYALTTCFNQTALKDNTPAKTNSDLSKTFNKSAYHYPERVVTIKSHHNYFEPIMVKP